MAATPPARVSRSPDRSLTARDDPELLYGIHAVEAALGNPARRIRRVWATRNAAQRLAASLAAARLEPTIVAPAAIDRITGADAVHQGVAIEALPLPQPHLDGIPRRGTVVVLDQVTDPHNVGAILRSAAAFAATALVTTARHSPEGSAVLAKAASGALEHIPFVKVTNLARALGELKGYGFSVLGLDSEAPKPIGAAAVREPLAIVLGAEGKGLRQLTRQTCDELVRLDLPGPINSLNVSNAATLALYALRQNRQV